MQAQDNSQEKPQRAIVAAVQLQNVSDHDLQASINELRELASTLGYVVVGQFVQKRDSFDSTAYLGTGKRQQMRQFVENGTHMQKEQNRRLSPKSTNKRDLLI
jgi:GTPase